MNQIIKTSLSFLVVIIFLFGGWGNPSFWSLAQSVAFDAAITCPAIIDKLDAECNRLGPEECKKTLEACGKFYQQKSDKYAGEISSIQAQKKTLQNQIAFLNSKINGLSSQINKNNLLVKDLNIQIDDTQTSIGKTVAQLNDTKATLSDLIQLQYEKDQETPLVIFLTGENFSSFFDNVMELEALNDQTQELLAEVEDLKNKLQGQQDSMVNEKDDLEKVIIVNSLQKEENSKLQNEKQVILKETKGKESLYQQYLAESKEKANAIRKKIFELAQVSGNQAINLEQAYALAKDVEAITGVRAVFILGLLKQESAIGKNVGQCNCLGAAVCRYPDYHFLDVNPSRTQYEDFKQITEELGMDTNKAPVSCSISGGKVQWGGAMGPAQFMPSTWLRSGYKSRVEQAVGVKTANPWRVKDAFMAAGLYLADNGAGSQKKENEIAAATAYLCGTKKMTTTCIRSGGQSYVYAIMKFAQEFQGYVDQGVFQK